MASIIPFQDKTNKDKVQRQPTLYVGKANDREEQVLAFVRAKLVSVKKHLCENEDEVDNFHPNLFTIPSNDAIKEALLRNLNVEIACADILHEMYESLLLGLGINSKINIKQLHLSCNNDMRSVIYYLEATKLAIAFHEKYNILLCVGDISDAYRASRMEGFGRLDTLGKMHLCAFGEFEGAGSDEWDIDEVSMMDMFTNAPGDSYEL